ncbi:MAG: DUF1501 domain-containing protein [Acidobacteriia bacterium]|nr:DUF1501 domain-containing protein [Terriglobia bacterium]
MLKTVQSTQCSNIQSMGRRAFLERLCGGLGAVGLTGMLASDLRASNIPFGPHFAPSAKHVIFLFLTGGPSHIDMFDPKPALQKYAGQRPDSVNLRTERMTGGLLPSPFKFQKYGQNGTEISELLPNLAGCVDELSVIRSMYTFNPTHTPARNLIHSGNIASTLPTLGAWLSYGLGNENENLPGFVVLSPEPGGFSGSSLWRSGFLPTKHQGTHFNHSETNPEKMIRYIQNNKLNAKIQRDQLDLLTSLNREHQSNIGEDAFLEARIEAMETAYRMQFEALDVFDIKKEPENVRKEYGSTFFANGCLLARRLVEKGVRYIHVFYGPGQPWDDHKDINKNLRNRCPDMDQAAAALLRDLKQRGLLEETLVVWGGEFGRTPVSESGNGRDHNPFGFTMWMAGGGIKGGMTYGSTDDFGFQAVENRVSVHDLHATILNQLGFDHEHLTYRYAGRDFRLTDVHGRVLSELIR